MRDTAGDARRNFYGALHMDVPALAERQELIYESSVRT